jgi:rhodanese-related sulfurtransferase
MIFGIGKTRKHHEIGASSLHGMITANQVVIVDVREPDEFAAGHIPGAINMPLSTFLPAALPAHPGKVVVLNCQGGKRSGMALDAARQSDRRSTRICSVVSVPGSRLDCRSRAELLKSRKDGRE